MSQTAPQPAPESDTPDQKLLLEILNELKTHTRVLRAMNRTIQLIGFIVILGIVLSCIAVILGGPSLLF